MAHYCQGSAEHASLLRAFCNPSITWPLTAEVELIVPFETSSLLLSLMLSTSVICWKIIIISSYMYTVQFSKENMGNWNGEKFVQGKVLLSVVLTFSCQPKIEHKWANTKHNQVVKVSLNTNLLWKKKNLNSQALHSLCSKSANSTRSSMYLQNWRCMVIPNANEHKQRFTSNLVLRTPNALPILLAIKNMCFILVFRILSRTPNLWCLLIKIHGPRGTHSKKISRQKSSATLILIQINWLKSLMLLADLCTQNENQEITMSSHSLWDATTSLLPLLLGIKRLFLQGTVHHGEVAGAGHIR